MTHDRSASIPLPAAEPRCEPVACTMRTRCARYQAEVKQGSPIGDFSAEHNGGTALCPKFVDSGALRSAASPRPVRRVHKPIGSGA